MLHVHCRSVIALSNGHVTHTDRPEVLDVINLSFARFCVQINHAFDHLRVTRNFNGPLLFIEEDHYLVEDFIPVLRMMYRLKARLTIAD